MNILVRNNILLPESFIINIKNKCALIGSCEVTILVNVKQHSNFLTKKLLANKDKIIPPYSDSMVSLVLVST